MKPLRLRLLTDRLTICQLAPDAAIPEWFAGSSGFASIVRTSEELSLVCTESDVPSGVRQEPGWRLLKIEGPLDFALTGILASITEPLARADISLFAISTFNTDYVLVRDGKLSTSVKVLLAAGHVVELAE